MNYYDIEAFLTVIECGSISSAAEKLYVGQPTLSGRIKLLEEELNVSLFNRKRGQKNTELTLAGHRFEPYAKKWMALLAESRQAVLQEDQDILRLSLGHSVNAYIMPDVYGQLSEKSRDCSLKLSSHHYYETYQLISRKEVDFGFVSNTQYARDLKIIPLFEEELVLLANNQSLYEDGVRLDHLNIRNEIYVEWDQNFVNWHRYWFGDARRVSVQTSDVTCVGKFVPYNDNWAIVPLTVAKKLCADGSLSYYHLKDAPQRRTTHLICNETQELSFVMIDILSNMEHVVKNLGGVWLYHGAGDIGHDF